MSKETDAQYRPGKGAAFTVNEVVVDWLQAAMEDLWNAAGNEGELNSWIDESKIVEEFFPALVGTASGWIRDDNEYGKRMYKKLDFGTQPDGTPLQYRVTAVWTKRGTFQIDFRQWFLPST